MAGPFEPKYVNPSQVISLHGNQVELVPATGGRPRKHLKYTLPAEKVISELPEYENLGEKAR